MDDLDRAIMGIEQVLSSTPKNHPQRAAKLAELGNMLHDRFKRKGSIDDINRAIATMEEATKAQNSDHNLSVIINSLGTFHRCRFDQSGSMDDLNAAIRMSELAFGLDPHDRTHSLGVLRNLGTDILK
jgi:hypothetical protein